MFHAFQETTEVRLPRQVIENAEEVASQYVLAILPVAKVGQIQLRVELSLEHDTPSIMQCDTADAKVANLMFCQSRFGELFQVGPPL